MKECIDIKGFEKQWGYAGVVKSGNTIYVSGLVSISDDGNPLAEGDMAGQIRNVYQDISRALRIFNATLSDVVKENIYTTDLDLFIHHKAERSACFEGHSLPASGAWHEVSKLAHPDFLVEIEVTAVLS